MLSESQERMLMVLKPGSEDEARRVFEKWELDFAVIGHGHRDRPPRPAHERRGRGRHADRAAWCSEAPLYERPYGRDAGPAESSPGEVAARDPIAALKMLLACPDLASKRWIWEQYDHLVLGQHGAAPGRRRRGGAPCPTASARWRSRPIARRAIAWPTRSAAARRPWPRAGATSPRSARRPSPSPTT